MRFFLRTGFLPIAYIVRLSGLLIVLTIIAIPPRAYSQAPPPPPPGSGGNAGVSEVAAPSGGYAPLDPRGLNQAYSSQGLPPGYASSMQVTNPIYGGTIFNYTAPTSPVGNYLAACLQGAGGLLNSIAMMGALRDQADLENERKGFQKYPGVSPGFSRSLGFTTPEQGCQKFVNKNDEIGPWGRTMLEAMDNYKDIYEEFTPRDIGKYCPSFSGMDAEKRKLFWLWFFASVSQPESSCRSNATSPGPNGTNIGLFQLEPPACARVGLSYSATDLLNPNKNIRCAVAVFANEMRNRDTVMIGTSRGRGGTYWGTLRNDDYNSARGADIGAAQKTRALIKQYPGCRN